MGKSAYIICQRNVGLEENPIKNEYFLLIVLLSGKMVFSVQGGLFQAEAPCCICFNEKENPKMERAEDADYFSIYFRPEILNSNLTFDSMQNCVYEDVAQTHELFLLSPFRKEGLKGPIRGETFPEIRQASENLYGEMKKEKDLYWHFRCRSWFMEILIALERMVEISFKNGYKSC